jgi:2',3'-cyclic-nucleotide 2'-phosphodiesterase (5'-nucleotidase family)
VYVLLSKSQVENILGKIKLTDELQSIRAEVTKLKGSGVEFIIALGHSGLEMDRRVAREVDGVDAVVGGHSHSYLFSGELVQNVDCIITFYNDTNRFRVFSCKRTTKHVLST